MNGTALIPRWYVEFQADVLRQLPRPGELDQTTAEGWSRNQKALKHVLADVLLPSQDKVHFINCDADPFIPSGWSVESHTKGGQLVFDPARIKLHLSPNQQDGKVIEGNKLRKELASEPVFNANVLDYLLAHPELIPEDWKKKDEKGETRCIFFWGTIYCSYGYLYVRCLYWRGGAWDWSSRWLGYGWYGSNPAAVLASLTLPRALAWGFSFYIIKPIFSLTSFRVFSAIADAFLLPSSKTFLT